MTVLEWDKVSEKVFETGVDKGVLYIPNAQGEYVEGYAWNGLISVSESPSGAESNKQYANNKVYLNLMSAEEFAATIEAFTFPDKFMECDGSAELAPGVFVAQQRRKSFGLSYRSLVGNDVDNTDFGYKLHLVYEGLAAPSEKAYTTVNDSPEAATFSWEVTTTPVPVPGHRSAATIVIDSTKVDAGKLADLEDILYGTAGSAARLPLPAEIIALFSGGALTQVMPVAPTYNASTDTITIPTVAGVVYQIDGEAVTGAVVITTDTIVTAVPAAGYRFPDVSDNDWFFDFV
jgi:hypothetical protein